MRNGTMRSKESAGVASSRAAPAMPPSAAATASRRRRGPWPISSGRDAVTEPTLLHTRATVFVTLALTGSRPVASTAG